MMEENYSVHKHKTYIPSILGGRLRNISSALFNAFPGGSKFGLSKVDFICNWPYVVSRKAFVGDTEL
jgi:hypothetical protein